MDNVPLLALVLYTGQVYVGATLKSDFRAGLSHVTGIVSNRTLGLDSLTFISSRSHLAPSINRPCEKMEKKGINMIKILSISGKIDKKSRKQNVLIILHQCMDVGHRACRMYPVGIFDVESMPKYSYVFQR